MDLTNISFTSIAGITAAGAILASTWKHIATFGRYVTGIVIGTTILKDDAGQAVMAYAFNNSRRSPLGKRVFGGYEGYVHPKRWRESIVYECLGGDPVLIKYGSQYAILRLGGNSNGSSNDVGEYKNNADLVNIQYFRWFFNVEKFIIDAIDHYNDEKRQSTDTTNKNLSKLTRFRITRYSGNSKSRSIRGDVEQSGKAEEVAAPTSNRHESAIDRLIMMGVYRLLKWKREDLQLKPEDGQSPFTGYPFPDEVGEAIKELNGWLSNEKWFRSKSIPWRRGWLLYGVPGTGKSTLVRSLGMSFDLPVYVFDLAGMTNDDLVASWESMISNTPCIALIEDIDAIFDGRKFIASSNPNIPHLTFDCLLNCISGVKQADGVFLVVTTNHIEKLDAALGIPDVNGKSTRPGRIDKSIHLGVMEKPQRILLAKHILSDYPELVEETVENSEGDTAAQFQSKCAQLALSRFWEDKRFLNADIKPNNRERNVEVMHFEPPSSPTRVVVGSSGTTSYYD